MSRLEAQKIKTNNAKNGVTPIVRLELLKDLILKISNRQIKAEALLRQLHFF